MKNKGNCVGETIFFICILGHLNYYGQIYRIHTLDSLALDMLYRSKYR
jgi:hypothetical protein